MAAASQRRTCGRCATAPNCLYIVLPLFDAHAGAGQVSRCVRFAIRMPSMWRHLRWRCCENLRHSGRRQRMPSAHGISAHILGGRMCCPCAESIEPDCAPRKTRPRAALKRRRLAAECGERPRLSPPAKRVWAACIIIRPSGAVASHLVEQALPPLLARLRGRRYGLRQGHRWRRRGQYWWRSRGRTRRQSAPDCLFDIEAHNLSRINRQRLCVT